MTVAWFRTNWGSPISFRLVNRDSEIFWGDKMASRLGAALCATTLGFGAFSAVPAGAQVRGSLPSREQIQGPQPAPEAPNGAVRVRDETRQAAPCAFTDQSIEVKLDRVRFAGPDGAALPSELATLLADVQARPGTYKLAYLCTLRDAAAARLNARGYIAAVSIPPQEITSGEAVLTVIAPRFGAIRVQGSAGRAQALLEARLERLKALTVLNTREIERQLLIANDVPGLEVAMALRAGAAPGTVDGDVVVRHAPFQITAETDNFGSRALGRESGTVRADYFGLFGYGSRTFVGGTTTYDIGRQQTIQAGHSVQTLGGSTIGVRGSYVWSRPLVAAGLDLDARSYVLTVEASTPLVRRVDSRADVALGFDVIDQSVDLSALGFRFPITRDRLRVFYLRGTAQFRGAQAVGWDRYGVTFNAEIRQGVDFGGATPRNFLRADGAGSSRFDGNAAQTVIRGGSDGFFAFNRYFQINAALQGQWSSGALLSYEEFFVGNLTLGRGYDPGITGGDKAIGGRIEPRFTFPVARRATAQLFGFYEAVRIWNYDLGSTEDDRSLRSWGVGARAALDGALSLQAFYARPENPELAFPGARRARDRFLFQITYQFTPRR